MARRDLLESYNARRDFRRTPEPKGKASQGRGESRFIVQKHDASRLHWDFRLELDGVLKSWAVTRGPSLDPDDKRLAVRTEDHPLSYAEFEGSIPKGEYGGGTVMLWDRGTWEPVEGKSGADLEEGHLHFRLHGERMKGEWLLVRMKGKPKEKRENWLLRKIEDEYSGSSGELVERELDSVLTGRTMAEIASGKGGGRSRSGKNGKGPAQATKAAAGNDAKQAGARRASSRAGLPGFSSPQLATLVDAVPTGNSWMHEIKFDGYRMLAAVSGDKVRLYTRSGLDWTDKFPPVAEALKALDLPAALIDGELVALDARGNPSFSALQRAIRHGNTAGMAFFAFDLLSLQGEELTPLPNIERKERLDALLADAAAPVHVADHVIGAGEKLFAAMCKAGQEGIISKRMDAPYRSARTRNWVKVKCTLRQEFVIIGWSRSSARNRPFASLLLGQREEGSLVYKGKVGTGFDAGMMEDLAARMSGLSRKTPPAEVPASAARGVQWITPRLVAEVAFAEFTADGRVRHASFVGLRTDKPAGSITPERAVSAPGESPVRISHRDRVIFPETGQTKGELADYYARIAPLMLPFAANRVLSLVRCPQGRARKCFFQKHDSGSFGPHVHSIAVREKDGGTEDYLHIADADGLLACVQMGTIEFHGWGSKSFELEQPDRMIFDLDPDEGLDFADVKRAAQDIRLRLSELGLVSFAMVSGGKGIHVVVPLSPGHDWETHKQFARRFAEALSLAEPDRYVATMSKARRKGRIFIDWLRNQRGSTAVLPYSARARAGAPVAVPVAWDELDGIGDARSWSIDDAATLTRRAQGKALKGWGFAAQPLPDA